jgi:hypothetical protein
LILKEASLIQLKFGHQAKQRKTKNIFDQIFSTFLQQKKRSSLRESLLFLLLFTNLFPKKIIIINNNLTYLELEKRERVSERENKKRNYFTTNKRSKIKLKFEI